MTRPHIRRTERGFTLLEILIAVLVLSLGVLGVAGMQVAGLRGNQGSLQRSQAAALAYEIADRMRANPVAARSGAYRLVAGAPGAGPTTVPASDCRSAPCTSSDLALADLYAWQVRVNETLPRGTERIECNGTCDANSLQTVTVYWDQDRTGAAGADCTDDPGVDLDTKVQLSCVRIFVQP